MNHDQLMPGIDVTRRENSNFDLEMFGTNKPLRGTKTAVIKGELNNFGWPKKKNKALNKVIDFN